MSFQLLEQREVLLSETLPAQPVLYVEDDSNDALFMFGAFRKVRPPNPLQSVSDGQEAKEYLLGLGRFSDRSKYALPCLILLDLNMPVCNGFEFLAWLRQESDFKTLPVIVFTASARESDKKTSAELGANEFITKPFDTRELPRVLEGIRDRWLTKSRAK